VTLLGFTDNVGNPIGNLRLSQQRAQGVATELNGIGIPSRVEGMGAEMPVATNDTVDGKAKNRRVEVWVTPN
jgi:phosphate transport system substrate-binding protein